jgi:hypothetical protein
LVLRRKPPSGLFSGCAESSDAANHAASAYGLGVDAETRNGQQSQGRHPC